MMTKAEAGAESPPLSMDSAASIAFCGSVKGRIAECTHRLRACLALPVESLFIKE